MKKVILATVIMAAMLVSGVSSLGASNKLEDIDE